MLLFFQRNFTCITSEEFVLTWLLRETQFFNTNGEIVLEPYNKYD